MNQEEAITIAAGAGAFGDGSHPTTRGVLAALEQIDPELFRPRNACDMGCGSGIVAFAAIRRFHCPVIAVDIAAQAVETLRQNAEANGFGDQVIGVHADGFNHPVISEHGPYDLLLMNILAEPLFRLASDAERMLAADGVLVMSGILVWQEQPLREAYTGLGLELTSRLTIGDWVTLVWQKAGAEIIN